MGIIRFKNIAKLEGPIVYAENIRNVAIGEYVVIESENGEDRTGKVITVSENKAAIQLFSSELSLSPKKTSIRFTGDIIKIPLSEKMVGRVFNGLGHPYDGLPPPIAERYESVYGMPINPFSRAYPRDFIQTGISAIDGLNTMVRGQKLPIFSGNGLPHNKLAAQIVRQARLKNESEQFYVVFAAMGVKYDVAQYFIRNFTEAGVLNKVTMFLSLASDPTMERLITPRSALTFAEYLAFEKNCHVLVILTDITNYCEALREISVTLQEVPSRKGYPGYLYSDLASLYERAGRIHGKDGSITQLPILTMPSDDITHPIPDLTGYITEGQIVLDRTLNNVGIYPPIAALPSLSRLMKDGIGKGYTRDDHPDVYSQLFASYSKVKQIRSIAAVIGEEELSEVEQKYLRFGKLFEERFINQGEYENRSIDQTLNLAWEILRVLPETELYRINDKYIEKYLRAPQPQ